jgi:RNA polymerase sigma-70 factor, ECF subfamily
MKQGQVPDEWLMGQVAHGKRDSLDILVRRYASPLLTFIARMIGDRHRGEELFQEVFLTVWIKRRQYDQFRRFKPWLYRIAINKCRESLRRRSLPVARSVHDDLPTLVATSNPSPNEAAVATETKCIVTNAVATLPDKQRTVLVLRVWSNLPYPEIALILNRSEATVRSNMHHALAGLRAYLEPRMH